MAEEGARIVVLDIIDNRLNKLLRNTEKRRVGYSVCRRITSPEDTKRMAEETVKQFNRIDNWSTNAAMLSGITRKPFFEIPVDEWDKLMAVN